MRVTRQITADKIADYLHGKLSQAQLVDWAENAIMNGEFEEGSESVLASVVARLGVADVRAFGLTWEDCEQLLKQLGFSARVAIVAR